ncbi:MAG: hypothetical protein ACFFCQ_10295 [Promethearchaeota archaeon]
MCRQNATKGKHYPVWCRNEYPKYRKAEEMAKSWRLKAKEALQRGKKRGRIDQSSFKALGFNIDPFSSDLPLEFDSAVYFDDRLEQAIDELGTFLTPEDAFPTPTQLLVVGANFVGKTILLQLMKEAIEEDGKIGYFVDATSLCDPDGVMAHRNFEIWKEKIDRIRPDIILIDNAAQLIYHPTVLGLPEFEYNPVIVASISYCELDYLEAVNNPKAQLFLEHFRVQRFYLRPVGEVAIVEHLKQRLNTAGRADAFTKGALKEIAKLSFGLMGLAALFGSDAIDIAVSRGDEVITKNHIKELAEHTPYSNLATVQKLIDKSNSLNSIKTNSDPNQTWARRFLKPPKINILRQALRQAGRSRIEFGISSMEETAALQFGMLKVVALADALGKQPSTLSHHLDDLKRKGFFEVYQVGREKPHYATREVIAALEVFFDSQLPKIEET